MGLYDHQHYINQLSCLSYHELIYLVNTQYQPAYVLTAEALLSQSIAPAESVSSEELPLGCAHVIICYFIWNQNSMRGVDPVQLAHLCRQKVLSVL